MFDINTSKVIKGICKAIKSTENVRPRLAKVNCIDSVLYATDSHILFKVSTTPGETKNGLYPISVLAKCNELTATLEPLDNKDFIDMDRFAVDAKNNEGVIVGVDIQKTIDILEVYKKSGQKHVRIKIGKPLDPIYFIGDNGEEFKEKIEEIEAILMPLKIK